MCGICGYLIDGGYKTGRELLERMNKTLLHRGPDNDGFYINGKIGMAMRRLAIIDVAGGQQPIVSEDGTVVVIFNGEIYNFEGLRTELEGFNHHFNTNSDTEVIVHAYEQWGDEALQHFNGMFAIALWDARLERLLLARDRMGKKPLYWHNSAKGLLWGSEAKALLIVPWVERHVNALALHHYLTLQYTPDPLTIFKDINQLPAAHKLVVERGGTPQITRWWQLAFEPKLINITEQEAIEQARVLISAAVKRRLISEVPLGAFLSGGIDSSIVVALMAESLSEPVKTFTIKFDEDQFSESQYAMDISKYFCTDHHEFDFRPNDLVRVIDSVITATDEPFADPAALPLYELARQARQYVTVALSGDGGDETLAGYWRYVLDGLLKPYSLLPVWFAQRFMHCLTRLIPDMGEIPEDRNLLAGLKRLDQFAAISPKASIIRWGSYFSQKDKMVLYTDRWRDEFTSVETADWIAAAYDEAQAKCRLDRTLYADHVTYLAGDLLPKTDRMTMIWSSKNRHPVKQFF